MRQSARPAHPLARLWRSLLDLSEVTVAIRYRAPWAVIPCATPAPERIAVSPPPAPAPMATPRRERVPA